MLAARTRYFAQMSHELRTPLNAILGYSGLLQEGVLGELSPHQADTRWRRWRRARDNC